METAEVGWNTIEQTPCQEVLTSYIPKENGIPSDID